MPEQTKTEICLTSDALSDIALSTIRATIGTTRYQYLSGPITGGRRLIEWHARVGRELGADERRAARKAAVIDPNIAEVQSVAECERNAGRPTIEPGSFEADHPHWGQPEFYRFWDRVIEQHAQNVRFIDGWEFSAGCTFEYLSARRHGRPTCAIGGDELGRDAALALIDAALIDLAGRYNPADLRDAPIRKLHEDIARFRDDIGALS